MRSTLAALVFGAVLAPVCGMAQDVSDDELLKLFLAQRDALRAAQEGNLGLTRGLTLVTADDVTVATEVPTLESPGSDTQTTTTGDDSRVAVTTQPAEPGAPDTDVVAVASTGPTVLVKVPEDLQVNVRIEFEFDSAALTAAQKPRLSQLCNVMKAADIQLFRIVGHTDASGTNEYNQRLSLLRAQEVQRYFIKDCGIEASRLEAVGLGERFLQDAGDPRADVNRRVEFQAMS